MLEDIVLFETSILMSVQSSTCLKIFRFSIRANFIECIDQLYFSKLVCVSHLQFVVSSIWGAAVEEGSWKSRLSLGCAFPRFSFALWLQALGSGTLLLGLSLTTFAFLQMILQGYASCDTTGDGQRRGCRRKFRTVSLGCWKRFEGQMQDCKCSTVVPST